MLGKLSTGLKNAIERIAGAVLLDKKVVDEVIKELQRALISSDVNVKLVFDLSNRIRERALKEKLPPGLNKKQHVIRIVYDELLGILGTGRKVELKKQKILLLGLYGSGKTTSTAKIARYFKKRGFKPCLLSTDIWRPAAYEQLVQLAEKINVPAYGSPEDKNAISVLRKYLPKCGDYDIIIVDSAGRDSIDKDLLEEIRQVNSHLKPDEKWLVLSGDMGQKAGEVAKIFDETVGLTGVLLTKMEGSAKGGGALSAVAQVNQPVIFLGVGEKIEELEEFDPNRFLQRILGFGDIKALMEKAQEIIEEEEFSPEDLLKKEYTLNTFYKQLQAQKKMGPLKDIIQMMGLQMKLPDDILRSGEERMKKYKYIMDSMTIQEKNDPSILSSSRIERIARGSGTTAQDVKHLIEDFNRSKKLIGMFKKGKVPRQLRRLMGLKGM